MEASETTHKLATFKITAIDWPKLPPFIEDSLLAIIQNSSKAYGDNQYEASKGIKLQLETLLGGLWTVIICPAD
jgi:hypothetical protein